MVPAMTQPERVVFEQVRRSVFVVETESGHGSGFLIDASGLIVTNDHVLGRGSYLAVGVDPDRKYTAVVVARDPSLDVAVIRVHPQAVTGVKPLTVDRPPGLEVRIGERVLAIGSAFTDHGAVLTIGTVSQIASNRILADLNVNSGTSGGPFLNTNGDVIGICTFYVRSPAGPGFAGIISIDEVRSVVSRARMALTPDPPSLERLPVPSPIPYPATALQERAGAIRDVAAYGTTLAGMRIDVLTPPAVYFEANQAAILKARKEGRGGRQEGYGWQALTGRVEPIVGIRVLPDARPRIDHATGRPLFRRNVLRMRLLRNGVEIVPIVPGRFCAEGCLALYQYCPEAFAPDGDLEVQVYLDGAGVTVWKLNPSLIATIWSDFAPWRDVVLQLTSPPRAECQRSSK
jgi:trypsin-like peptidase